MTTVRVAAARTLETVEAGRWTLPAALDRERVHLADERDRGLLVELALGTLRWRAELDALLDWAGSRPLSELDPGVRATLRLATYQLRHLDRIPAHAVIHEAVEATRALGHPQAAGYVNAVLRRLQREHARAETALPPAPSAEASRAVQLAYLSTTLSHPAWLVERWLARYGYEATEAWCRFNNSTPEVTVRPLREPERARPTPAAGAGAPSGAAPGATRLAPGTLSRLPAELKSQIMIQDEGSQLVARAVGAEPGQRCLDLCAAPGGKTALLWQTMGRTGTLVAADRRPRRLRLLRQTLERSDVPRRLVLLDATAPLPFGAEFDRVLVDAPCSGLGTIRRDPDIKWLRQPADLARFALTQAQMLRQAGAAVRPGGWLIYATCSSEPDENEAVVAAFLAFDRRFRARPVVLADQPSVPWLEASGVVRTLPFRDHIDAYFAAVLERSSAA